MEIYFTVVVVIFNDISFRINYNMFSHYSFFTGHRVQVSVGNFRQKIHSSEDGIDGLFRRNSGYCAEQKFCGTPFRTSIPRERKMLGIPFHGPKIEANSRNSEG